MHILKKIGLGMFLFALGLFIMLLFMTRYEVDNRSLARVETSLGDQPYTPFVVQALRDLQAEDLGGKFGFLPQLQQALNAANDNINQTYGVQPDAIEASVMALTQAGPDGGFTITDSAHMMLDKLIPGEVGSYISQTTGWLIGRTYDSKEALADQVRGELNKKANEFAGNYRVPEGGVKDIKFKIVKATSTGLFWDHPMLFFGLIMLLGAFGALLYIYPAFFDGNPGIKHNHIYHSSATSRGLIGILTSAFLVGFYLLLYFYHFLIAEWISLMDPAAMLLTGNPASRWFMYGFLYTIAILVMGIRMLAKYRHSRYHQFRTVSVMFFQTAFAFIIPEILVLLNQPYMDLKNTWPLNYSFFFEYNINTHIQSGQFGLWMLGWGIALTAVGVPLFTYFYGKRWYCSWVCGCGGLAETLGDPYRQLSDKTTEAWQIERVLINAVLVFAVVMTGLVLYTFYDPTGINIRINQWVFLGVVWAVGVGLFAFHRRKYPHMKGNKIMWTLITVVGAITVGVFINYFPNQNGTLTLNSYDVRSVYGFAIGSMFAGVVGTGLYPILGNRPWCRFGCPLAGYLGLVQRFKSRFRITTNGGQCISCGNCSTYCEMGIDVRAYAQKGQNIVRSSCVGCGVCAAVCPRGVLSLENMDNDDTTRMEEVRY